jgi:hypothetical protein
MKSQTFYFVILKQKKLIFLWKIKNLLFRREDPKTLIFLIGIILYLNKIKFSFRKDPNKLIKSTLGITAQLILRDLIKV